MASDLTTPETVAPYNKTPLPRRSLRAMKRRWQADLERLEAAYPAKDWEGSDPALETIRNLATAIAEIDGLISCRRVGERQVLKPTPDEVAK